MINAVHNVMWKGIGDKIHAWWCKHNDNLLIKVNAKREQSIGILQKRYGYTREKAASEFKKHYSNARLD